MLFRDRPITFDHLLRRVRYRNGVGAVVALILAELGHRVTGIDWSVTMLDQAREKAQKAGLEITFVEGEIENLPFPDASFDLVVARHVLWTLVLPEQTLAEWHRVLRPNGRALVDYSPRRPGEIGHRCPVRAHSGGVRTERARGGRKEPRWKRDRTGSRGRRPRRHPHAGQRFLACGKNSHCRNAPGDGRKLPVKTPAGGELAAGRTDHLGAGSPRRR
ncbi:MAG: class I SAM-dependent methyltransferase [Clostridia bacterium]|nr:MAG: class I SAM-dependent methyltransferase [Clostridia bacterium]